MDRSGRRRLVGCGSGGRGLGGCWVLGSFGLSFLKEDCALGSGEVPGDVDPIIPSSLQGFGIVKYVLPLVI